jgi:PAS domain S-box-containing protein
MSIPIENHWREQPTRLSEWITNSRLVPATLGGYAVLGGLGTLTGWVLDVQRLTDWEGNGISMMPNTAIAAVVAGTALILLAFGYRRAVLFFGLIGGLIGASALFEHITGIDLGIDKLIVYREWGQRGTVVPGRMSLPGATSFTLIGTALILATGSWRRGQYAVVCAVLVTCVAMLSLMGFLFGASTLYSIPHLTAIALQTATMTLAIALGIVFALPRYEPMRTLLADSASGTLSRRFLPFIIILPLVLGKLQSFGRDMKLFDANFGTAALVLTLILFQGALVWWAATEIAAYERELRRRTNQLSLFLESAAIGLHRVGPDGTILWVNAAELEMLGYRAEEYVGHHITKFHVDQEVITEILARLSRGEKLHDYPARMKCKDGSIRDVAIDSSVLFEQGRFIHTQCFTHDVTLRKQAEEFQASLAAIVEASDDAIISKTLDGIIRSWNASAERIFGYSAEEVVGKSIELLIPPDLRTEEHLILGRLRNGERIRHFETVRVGKDGRRIDISLTISPIRDRTGRVIGASKFARDISERKKIDLEREQLLESERSARTQAEQAGRLKDEFLATVSHELRTPLNSIMGWAQFLKRTRQDKDSIGEGINAIERGARMQAQIIDDLLDMNRIVFGKLRLEVQTTDLTPIIEGALETVRLSAEAKNIRIHKILNPGAGPIKGDPTRLQQVIWNLLSNAVKFTPKGGKIQVLLERINSHIEISVADTGIGITNEFLPHVFERFRQADSSTSRQHGGLGIGLAIAKQIVELHGGSLTAISEGEGKGAIFQIQLPISAVRRPLELDGPIQNESSVENIKLSGVRILVVDDDPGACEILRQLLTQTDAEVETISSGIEALPRILESAPDILLCDIGMPGMDGFEVIRTIRERGLAVPAVAITAFARPEDRIRSLQAGFNMHLSKPIDARELLIVIDTLLRTTARDRTGPS